MREPEDYLVIEVRGDESRMGRCEYCGAPTTYYLATGADMEPAPVCGSHAEDMLAACGALLAKLRPGEKVAV